MGTIYAFVDETGAYGFSFDKQGCSSHFIVTVIVVRDENLTSLKEEFRVIKNNYFPNSEMKSSTIGKNHNRRMEILKKIISLPFHIYYLVVDKRELKSKGLHEKTSFYKFINNLVYTELQKTFNNLKIIADEFGSSEYMKSFARYVREKEVKIELFDDHKFYFDNSKNEIIIQLADFIGGCISYHYESEKVRKRGTYNYLSVLNKKILGKEYFPKMDLEYKFDDFRYYNSYDENIARICYRRANAYIVQHKTSKDEEVKWRLCILKYMIFMFLNRNIKYIYTKELIEHLYLMGYPRLSKVIFRNKIIAKLRDAGVIIASCKYGYKIPINKKEIIDYIEHSQNIIQPMINRVCKCNDAIKLGSNNTIDLLENTFFEQIKNFY